MAFFLNEACALAKTREAETAFDPPQCLVTSRFRDEAAASFFD
jgi:hypothetical protein